MPHAKYRKLAPWIMYTASKQSVYTISAKSLSQPDSSSLTGSVSSGYSSKLAVSVTPRIWKQKKIYS